MVDIADRAGDIEQADRDRALARQALIAQSMHGGVALTDCAECGTEIDPARRAALPFVGNCIDCARAREHKLRSMRCTT